MINKTTLFKAWTIAALSAALIACGGGGGGAEVAASSPTPEPAPAPAPAPTLSSIQGFWNSALSGTSSASAVILPDGQAWVVYETAGSVTALAQASLSVSGATYSSSGSGKYYSLPGGVVQDYSLSGSLPASNTDGLSNSIRIGSGTATAMTWTYNNAYETPVSQSSVQGRWSGMLGANSVLWEFDAAGKLAGTSTTGCTYSGSLTPNATALAVLDAAITETCAGTKQSLSGIARLSADKGSMSLAYTTAAGAQGGVVVLAK